MESKAFDVEAFLNPPEGARNVVEYRRGETIFTQGTASNDVLYIQTGGVKLSVISKAGKEVVMAMLGPGDFFGEGCLAGQPLRMSAATAVTPSMILRVGSGPMVRLLQRQHAMATRFVTHMLSRNIRLEEDLIAQLAVSRRKRVAGGWDSLP